MLIASQCSIAIALAAILLSMQARAQGPPGAASDSPTASPDPVAGEPDSVPPATDSRAPRVVTPPRSDLDLLTLYKDNYFLTGFTTASEVKFQFSAKFDIWPNRSPHAAYFAFTQRSLWDAYRTSQPFRESNYEPELHYTYYHAPSRYDPRVGCGFFLERIGFVHASNGLGGNTSRGWNRVYGESRFACYNDARSYFLATLELWASLLPEVTNKDITAYEGYGELSLSVGSDSGQGAVGDWDLTVHGRKGTLRRLDVGSIEIDMRWRPRYGDLFRFTPYLYAQMFTGYGETLLDYNHSHSAFRVGIGFTARSTRSE
jgi:phospholipase A1